MSHWPGSATQAARRCSPEAARGEVAAEAPADQGDALRVDLAARERVVHDRGHDVLPVRSHVYPLLVEHPTLPGTVEDQAVVPPPHGRCGVAEVHALDGRVVAVGGDDRRAWLARGVYAVEVAGQGGPLVGDLDRIDGRLEEGGGLQERPDLPVETLDQPRIHRGAEQERVGGAVVVAGAQVRFPGAHPVPRGSAPFGQIENPIGGSGPLPVPSVRIAFLDPPGGR